MWTESRTQAGDEVCSQLLRYLAQYTTKAETNRRSETYGPGRRQDPTSSRISASRLRSAVSGSTGSPLLGAEPTCLEAARAVETLGEFQPLEQFGEAVAQGLLLRGAIRGQSQP
jgi:hypothetical protein